MARRTRYNLMTLLRHPLPLIVLPLFVAILISGYGEGARLLVLEPIAMASSSVKEADPASLSSDQRAQLVKIEADADRVSLAHVNNLLMQSSSQIADFAAGGIEASAPPIPARILMRGDSSMWRHSIRINRGADHGIKAGYAVTVGRTLIGVVTHCTANLSVVSLITDPGMSIGVSILPKNGEQALAMLKSAAPVAVDAGDKAGSSLTAPGKGGSLKDLSLLQDSDERSATTSSSRGRNGVSSAANAIAPIVAGGTPEEMARALGPTQRASRGMLRGSAKSKPRIPHLPIEDIDVNTGVTPGMLVVSNGAAGAIPAGLLVGFVSEVSNRNTFLHVEVACGCDISLVDVVLVIPHDRPSWDEITRTIVK